MPCSGKSFWPTAGNNFPILGILGVEVARQATPCERKRNPVENTPIKHMARSHTSGPALAYDHPRPSHVWTIQQRVGKDIFNSAGRPPTKLFLRSAQIRQQTKDSLDRFYCRCCHRCSSCRYQPVHCGVLWPKAIKVAAHSQSFTCAFQATSNISNRHTHQEGLATRPALPASAFLVSGRLSKWLIKIRNCSFRPAMAASQRRARQGGGNVWVRAEGKERIWYR